MAFEKLTENIKGLTSNTQEYVKHSSEYYKLKIFKNSMKGLIGVANVALRATFGLICLLFLSVGVAIVISEAMDSPSAGYFIVGAFYFVVFILVFIFAKKPIERYLLLKYSKMVFNDDEDKPLYDTTHAPQNDIVHESIH